MQTGDVVHLFEGKRRTSLVKRDGLRTSFGRAWARVTSFAAAVAEVARESRELEKRLLNQHGYRRFIDR
jgi:hypothetical protein